MGLLKIFIFAFLGVAVVGGGTYAVMNNRAHTADDDTQTEGGIQNEVSTEQNTLRGLMQLGQRVMCTFTSVAEATGGTVTGAVYIDGGRVRGDFDIAQAGMQFDSHVIITEGKMYTWTYTPQGTFAQVMTFDPAPQTNMEVRTGAPVSVDDAADYTCSPWGGDASKFVLPTSLTFTRLEDMVQGAIEINERGAIGSSAGCGACAQIPDANAKAQCLSALQCN